MEFKKLIFISGKGGTGKTTLGLLIAKSLAESGKKVLFAELTSRSSAKALLESSETPVYRPTPSKQGFDWCLLNGLDCLVEYVGYLTKVEKIAQNFLQSPLISPILNLAPGLNDLAILGKLTSGIRDHGPGLNYDHIVVDAHSTGHFSSLLAAPKLLGASVTMGPLKTQSQSIEKTLSDENLVQYIFIGLFEPLPFDELMETRNSFDQKYKKQISIVMNKHLELNNITIEEPGWQSYMGRRLAMQRTIIEKLKVIQEPTYSCSLLMQNLKLVLNQELGGILRPLSNH